MKQLKHNSIARLAICFFDVMGPILLSAFSIFVTFCLLQPLALWLDPSFSLLANRSVGKIAFTILVIMHILLLLAMLPKKLFQDFLKTNLYFLGSTEWIKPFATYFLTFFVLHSLVLAGLFCTGYVQFHPETMTTIPLKIGPLCLGFVATFFLAWTEEAIFRGALFTVLRQRVSPVAGIIIASAIFSLAHDLTNPINLITTDWQLGLGLFLLGMLLNILFFLTNTLYVGMGAHAGLVYVKVLLRRVPMISYQSDLPWWLNSDLRISVVTHLLFALVIISLFTIFRRRFANNAN